MHYNFSKRFFIIFIFLGIQFFWGQTPVGITTSVGKLYNISLCEGDLVTFTLDPFTTAPSAGEEYVFYRVRSGVATATVQLQSTANTYTATASATGMNGLLDGDKIYGQRINNNTFPVEKYYTELITVSIHPLFGASSFDGGTIDQADQLICSGDIPYDLTVSSVSSGTDYLYQWQRSTDNINFTDITGTTHEVFVMSTVTQTTFFRRRIRSTLGGSCEKYSTSHLVEVSDLNPGVLDPSQNQTICFNTSPGILESGVGGSDASSSFGTLSYQWQQSYDNFSWSNIASATTASYFPPPLTQTTYYKRVASNELPNGSSCALSSNVVSITVVSPTISFYSSVSSNTFCNGESITFTASGSLMYEFLINGTTVQGPSATNTYSTVLTQSSSVTLIASGYTCTETLLLNMYRNDVQAGTISGTQTICYGEAAELISVLPGSVNGVTLVGSGTGNYQWQSSLDNISWTDVPSATSADFTDPSLLTSTYFRRNTVNTLNGVFCSDVGNWIYVTVGPLLNGGTIDQSNQLACAGDPLSTLTVSGGTSGGNIVYQWQESTDGGTTFVDIPFETNPVFTPGTVSVTTRYRRMTSSTVGNCEAFSNDHLVTINEIIPGSLDPSQNTTVCFNSIPPSINSGLLGADASSGIGSITYQWQVSYDNVNWTDLVSATLASFTPTSNSTQTTWFRRTGYSTIGSLVCSATTNVIQVDVFDEIIPGFTLGDQTICEGDIPRTLNLNGVTAGPGYTYQWQMSTDNINFSNISNTGTSLNFTNATSWSPSITSYYRVLTSNLAGCTVTSTVAEIEVIERPTINQISGVIPMQYVCPGSAIVSTSFEIGGGATGITTNDLTGTGLTFTGPVGNVYTLSGIPTTDVAITLTASATNPCTQTSIQYNILIMGPPMDPTAIRIGVNDENHTVFQQDQLWYNNTVCKSNTPTSTTFYVCEEGTFTSSPTYEWSVTPGIAGIMNTATGELSWNNAFTGTATISVRSLSCAGNSAWLETPIQVVSSTTVASQLTTPTVLMNPICGLETTEIPVCEITSSTLNTRFYTTTASGTADYASINWSINNIFPGGGIGGVSTPGTIDPLTGEVTWNDGFWGRFDIVATPANCDGTNGTPSVLTINLIELEDTAPSIFTVSPTAIPLCPPAAGEITRFTSDIPVNWSIDNPGAGIITSTGTYTAEIAWNTGFSGVVNLTATASGTCLTGQRRLRIFIPSAASIVPPLGLSDITICQGTFLNGVEFRIEGFPNSANVVNLPSGVTGVFSATHHIVDIRYTGTGFNGQTYSLEILGQTYSYTIVGTQTADQLVYALANEVNTFPGARFTATRIAPNTLRLRTKVAGFQLSGTVYFIPGSITVNNGDINTIERPERTITLTGTVTADPGTYDYTITTEGGGASCTNVSRIGRIVVTGQSSITLGLGSDDNQEICFGDPISPINYTVNHALYAVATGLPNGLTQSYSSSTGLTISGTPSALVTQTTVYNYLVQTQNNANGCSPEATASGTITIQPQQLIALSSAAGSDNQTICNSGPVSPLTPITYQLSGNSFGYTLGGSLPPGITAQYDPGTRVITLSGSPTMVVSTTTIYNYSITTSGTYCTPMTVSGTITVEAQPSIRLMSPINIANQTGANAICVGTSITPISFIIANATAATATNLPPGVSLSQSGNIITISGIPNLSSPNATRFNYTVTAIGASCASSMATYSGYIDVIPLPIVDELYITNNDLVHVSCNGLSDGAIDIPLTSPDFDLRIRGGQNAIAQIDRIDLNNQPNLGDVYYVTIDGKTYSHTVINSSFGGAVQTPAQVASELVDEINQATGILQSDVEATFDNPSGILLVADQPGVQFTLSTNLNTSYSGSATPTISNSGVASNVTVNYTFLWTGPNGFSSSNLNINNLEAGVYHLSVNVGSCSSTTSQASFTILEPDPILVDTQVCNGGLRALVEGGVAPYTIELFDSLGNLLRTDYTTAIQNYTGLISGVNYRLSVLDSSCSIPTQIPVTIPFSLSFDPSVPLVIDDYCNDGDGSGFIELGGNSSGEAFSGGSNQFSYRWIGGPSGSFNASTRDIYDLHPGNYSVTVTDLVLGCTSTQTFTVGSVNQLEVNVTANTILNTSGKIDLKCLGDKSALIEINVTGGLGNYTYAWTRNGTSLPGENRPRLENLGAGVYEVTISDAAPIGIGAVVEPCKVVRIFEVVEPAELKVMVNAGTSTNTTTVFCPEESNSANFDIQILGGVAPYNVEITAEDGTIINRTISNNSSQTITGLDPSKEGNTYAIKVIDANDCTPGSSSSTITFQSVEAVSINVDVQQIDCKNGVLGSIRLDVVEGIISNPNDVQIQWISANSNLYHTWSTNNGVLDNISVGGKYNIKVTLEGCTLFEAQNIEISDIDNKQLAVSIIRENSGSCGDLGLVELGLTGGTQPYQIQWEIYTATTQVVSSSVVTVTSSSSVSTPTSVIETEVVNEWVRVSRLDNNAVASDLEPGVYRAIVKDGSNNVNNSNCGGTWISRNFNIGSQRFELINFVSTIDADSCDGTNTAAEISFELLNTIPNPNNNQLSLKIYLDGIDITNDVVKNGSTYKYGDIGSGDHSLLIEPTRTTTPTDNLSSCSAIYPFTVEELTSIIFEGETEYELDLCQEFIELTIDTSKVSGGVPFSVDGVQTYDYEWNYSPADNINRSSQIFVGDTIFEAYPGVYELTISDSRPNCLGIVQTINVSSNQNGIPFNVKGNLQDFEISTNGSPTISKIVKSLAPTCESEIDDGRIGIEINGGIKPYTITWYREEIISGTDSVSLVELTEAQNSTQLYNLSPGKYKLEIASQGTNACENLEGLNSSNYYEEIIIVPKNEQLYIIDGPVIDEDLCQGLPGRIYIEIFDNLQKGLTFYYNNEIINLAEDQPSKEGAYILLISEPQKEANLLITNSEGCSVSKVVKITDIGAPDFKYTSPAFEADGSVSAREEVTFSNTSELPYSYSEWNFGDGSAGERVVGSYTLSPTTHTFGISGTYFVTLRNFNDLGCYEEITKQIVVGKGYNVLIPNAFSPNGDRINDTFRPLFSGFGKVIFNVYDNYGNQLYEEVIEEPDTEIISGIELKGWEGFNANDAPYYIYRFVGNLLSDGTEIERSGTFVLFK